MNIKYKIQTIENAQGEGKERHFVRLVNYPPMSEGQLEKHICQNSSLTEGDLKSALYALRESMIRELLEGKRFYLPSIGYFSLSVDLDMPEDKAIEKVRGDYISVRNINFLPDADMLQTIKNKAKFERSTYTSTSTRYTEEELVRGLREYLIENKMINRSKFQSVFGVRKNKALQWLKHFTETGLIKKYGPKNSPMYCLNEENV